MKSASGSLYPPALNNKGRSTVFSASALINIILEIKNINIFEDGFL
jgi:hypothetical protein